MPLRKKNFLPVSPPYIPALVQSLLNLGKPGRVLALQGIEKFVLTDALTTYFFLPRLNVGFVVIQEYPFEGLADELYVLNCFLSFHI